ncbi:hypothetical protein ABZX95_44555 [Streptomyces sp. NPDC004232]|uniref:hypothetical protein n=1 Tax=Streptomyces sp. NPDC004232 TaxID=3154454 RepID=UPI0033A54ADA
MAPIRVSDVIERRTWRQSRTYAEPAGSKGMRYELIVPLVVSSHEYSALGIFRADRDLTDSDRETAARLQPVLIGLHTLAARVVRPTPPDSFAGQLALPKPLPAREREALRFLCRGLTTRAVAHRLMTAPVRFSPPIG